MFQRNSNSRTKLFSSRRLLSSVTLIVFSFSLMLGIFTIASSSASPVTSPVFNLPLTVVTYSPGQYIFQNKVGTAIKLGEYKLQLWYDGNLRFMKKKQVLWQSNTGGKGYNTLKLESFGVLKLINSQTKASEKITPALTGSINSALYMDSTGKFQIMGKYIVNKFTNLSNAGKYSEIFPNKEIAVNAKANINVLSKGVFNLVLTKKGNLALRRLSKNTLIVIWNSGTNKKGVSQLGFSLSDNKCVLELKAPETITPIWNVTASGLTKLAKYKPSLRLYESGGLVMVGWKETSIIE